MAGQIKTYKINDFVKYTETGKLDFERSASIIHELSIAADHHKEHDILLDFRETVADVDMSDVMKVAAEFGRYRNVFQNKIAVLIPNSEHRLEIAKQVRACMDLQGFQFNQFTDFEAAIEWLSMED